MSVPTLTITPAGAASAYAKVGNGNGASVAGSDFGAALGRAMESLVHAGHEADSQAVRAIKGEGNLTEVALAVSRAELALQGAVAVRDKVVQAYQDIMRMPI